MTVTSNAPAAASGTFDIAGKRRVHRLGFGAMQLTGPGIWGPPADRETARRVARRAVELGVDFIDTADSYGPTVSEEIVAEALHPYPDGLTIATKAGLVRTGPDKWRPLGRPEYLRQQCELSLRRLRVERIDLFQLHRIDRAVPAEDQFGTLAELLSEGKIAHVGLSKVSVEQVQAANRIVEVATVQNCYNLATGHSEPVLDYCTEARIGFIPFFPLAAGDLVKPGGPVSSVASRLSLTAAQVALAWLLARSPAMLPIPGTSSVEHVEENCAAGAVTLDDEAYRALEAAHPKS